MLTLVEDGKFTARFTHIYALLLSEQINFNAYLFFSTKAKAERIGSYININDGNTMIRSETALHLSDGRIFPLTYGKGKKGVKLDKEGIRDLKHPEQVETLLELL